MGTPQNQFRLTGQLYGSNVDKKTTTNNGPLESLVDIFKNFDDVIDDFMNKRMGKGEIFYGKRKFDPSGDVDGEYNGFGLTDKTRIEITRARKEEWLEEKRMRMEMEELWEEREMRKKRGDL